jgi:hypothetical protein
LIVNIKTICLGWFRLPMGQTIRIAMISASRRITMKNQNKSLAISNDQHRH